MPKLFRDCVGPRCERYLDVSEITDVFVLAWITINLPALLNGRCLAEVSE